MRLSTADGATGGMDATIGASAAARTVGGETTAGVGMAGVAIGRAVTGTGTATGATESCSIEVAETVCSSG